MSLLHHGRGVQYCLSICSCICLSVCLSVRSHNSKPHGWTSPSFCACCPWPWLRSPLTALRYVMYFRFYKWRHVFIPRRQRSELSTTLRSEEFARWRYRLDVRQLQRQNAAPGAEFAIYGCNSQVYQCCHSTFLEFPRLCSKNSQVDLKIPKLIRNEK